MKKYFLAILTCSLTSLTLSACGGGGGSTPPVPTTKVVLTAYLFGTMSSSTANVTDIDAEMTVPSGVFVDYSSPAPSGYPANTFPVRNRSIITPGIPAATTSGTYNTQSGKIKISILNTLASNRSIPSLRSSSTGSGTEFAKLYFKLNTADSNVPFQPSNQSLIYDIKQTDLSSQTSGVPARGSELKFSTTYQ